MRKNAVFSIITALFLLLASCTAPISDASKNTGAKGQWGAKDELFGVACDMRETFNPLTSGSKYNVEIAPLVFEGLISVHPNGKTENKLCKSFSQNGNALTFMMADRVFSDGSKITAYDAEYSLNMVLNQKKSYYNKRLDAVASIKASSADTLVINLKYQKPGFVFLLDIPIIKKDSDKGEYPIGSGLYFFNKDDQISLLHLAVNANYPIKSSDYFSRIELVDMPYADALLYKFDAGDVDLLPVDLLDESQPGFKGKYETVEYTSNDFIYLGVNCTREPFNNAKLRLALGFLIDRAEICSTSLFGRAEPALIPFRPGSIFYDTALIESSALSRDQAYSELEASGYKKDSDGLYKNASKKKLDVEILVPDNSYYKLQAARGVASQLKSHGIEASAVTLGWNEILSRVSSKNYDMFIGEVRFTNDFDMEKFLVSPYPAGLNTSGITPENIVSKIPALLPDGSGDFLGGFIQAFYEDYPVIPLYFRKSALLIKSYGIDYVTPAPQNPYHGVDAWIIK